MIIPDINLLVYAYNDGAPFHDSARQWWEDLVNRGERIGIPWVVSTGFVRLMTHPKVLEHPLSPEEAVGYVGEWFRFPTYPRSTRAENIWCISGEISMQPVSEQTW